MVSVRIMFPIRIMLSVLIRITEVCKNTIDALPLEQV